MFNQHLVYVLFFFSGFSGLIYELLWTNYLKMFLGHSAYAQSLVLCIFMGGMALGSYLAGFFSKKIKKPLLIYGIIEFVIGVFALVFHLIFKAMLNFSYDIAIPSIDNSFWIVVYKITMSSLIIFPQTVLLGITFPIIATYFIRRNPDNLSKTVSLLYFSNSIGAALGIFISGFYLVENFGMPITIVLGGLINVAIFLVILMVHRRTFTPVKEEPFEKFSEFPNKSRFIAIFFILAFTTSFSSFIYEIVWIRMLSLVLGSSTHNFEIMLCAFITGIAFGGLYIKLRANAIKDYVSYLATVQILMGIAAVATLPMYNNSFEIISYLMNNLPKTEFGYYLFNLSSHAISFVVMLPATFFAGMTFPLLSYIIYSKGYGEKAVGYTYAANTIGAILGVIFAVHIGFSFLGLKNLLFLGSILDISLGLILFFNIQREKKPIFSPKLVSVSSCSLIILSFMFLNLDKYKLASGVYREGVILTPKDYHLNYYKDGKTASISVVGDGQYVSVRTNGKSDSAIALSESIFPSADEFTASLAALIPYFYNPDAKKVAVIGLGTGLTSHVALLNPHVSEVDTIEIEEKMIEGSKNFISRNYMVFNDKRSKIYVDDAKTFFSMHRHKYDIIVSEPSNPWISGISALFSKEFYVLVNKYLNNGGIFVQWLQLYEIDMPHIASIVKAISNNFADYALYVTTENELLIITSNQNLGCLKDDILHQTEIRKVLNRLNIKSLNDILIRKIGDRKHFDVFFNAFDIEENSDFHPIIERNGPKLRFYGAGAREILGLNTGSLPILELLFNDNTIIVDDITPTPYYQKSHQISLATKARDFILKDKASFDLPAKLFTDIQKIVNFIKNKELMSGHFERLTVMFNLFSILIPNLPEQDVMFILDKIEKSKYYKELNFLEKLWLKLYRAVKQRDYKSMTVIAMQLLEKDKAMPPIAEEYLMAVYLVGNIALERKVEVKNYLQASDRIISLTENNIIFKYLKSYCE